MDLGGVLDELTRSLEGLARERGVALVVHAQSAQVSVDRDQLARALRNVVTNALQHSPSGKTVRLTLATTPGAAQVRVTDEGAGISAEDMPHVFERFYRADRARSPEENGGRRGSGGRRGEGRGLADHRDRGRTSENPSLCRKEPAEIARGEFSPLPALRRPIRSGCDSEACAAAGCSAT